MINNGMDNSAETMTIPKTIFFNSLKEAILSRDEERIQELGDLLYNSMYGQYSQNVQIQENRERIDRQHTDIVAAINAMKDGFQNVEKHFEAVEKHFEAVDKHFEAVDKRFEAVDKRFEAVDKRFEAVDKRFEAVDKRFDDLIHQMDKRFESMDKRFDGLIHQMDKRFAGTDKRFSYLTWLISIGFVVINSLVIIFKFFP